jgi:nitrate reductase cytochrome c-type subunit
MAHLEDDLKVGATSSSRRHMCTPACVVKQSIQLPLRGIIVGMAHLEDDLEVGAHSSPRHMCASACTVVRCCV